ncbi:MAG TPA: hypothetical protein VFE03_11970 [Caulobacteraceae bacterium]|jgi:hypothetical protein|nr:hypothetical protein [Caulobacteraceae bacterium]
MSATHLVVVPRDGEGPIEPLAQRVRRLQAEARGLAKEHVEQLRASLAEVARLASEIADGGEAYPVGAREMSRRLMEDAAAQALTLAAINDRSIN